jgi:hypothetical protein
MTFAESSCPEDVFSLRLAERSGEPVLLMASMIERVPHAVEPGGTPFPLGPAPWSVHVDWDVRPRDGGWDTVVTQPGSSICRLHFRDRHGELSTSEETRRDVYQRPRFVRGSDRQATAISDDQVVLLERDPSGRLAVSKLIDAPRNGDLQEAVLAGSRLFHTSYFQGSIPLDATNNIPHRTLWMYETVKLGFAVEAPDGRPFGNAPVYQIDAHGDVLFATTPEGYRVAIGGQTREGTVGSAELVSPTILVIGRTLHVAAIARRRGDRTIVRAEMRI